MDYTTEIQSLSGETLALQTVIVALCCRLAATNPQTAALVRGAFDDAANFVEMTTLTLGKTAASQHTIKALRVVEELRAATFDDHQKPKHGV